MKNLLNINNIRKKTKYECEYLSKMEDNNNINKLEDALHAKKMMRIKF